MVEIKLKSIQSGQFQQAWPRLHPVGHTWSPSPSPVGGPFSASTHLLNHKLHLIPFLDNSLWNFCNLQNQVCNCHWLWRQSHRCELRILYKYTHCLTFSFMIVILPSTSNSCDICQICLGAAIRLLLSPLVNLLGFWSPPAGLWPCRFNLVNLNRSTVKTLWLKQSVYYIAQTITTINLKFFQN